MLRQALTPAPLMPCCARALAAIMRHAAAFLFRCWMLHFHYFATLQPISLSRYFTTILPFSAISLILHYFRFRCHSLIIAASIIFDMPICDITPGARLLPFFSFAISFRLRRRLFQLFIFSFFISSLFDYSMSLTFSSLSTFLISFLSLFFRFQLIFTLELRSSSLAFISPTFSPSPPAFASRCRAPFRHFFFAIISRRFRAFLHF
jgi:hypothetical protein